MSVISGKTVRYYSKTCLKRPLKRRAKIVFKTAGQKYCKILPLELGGHLRQVLLYVCFSCDYSAVLMSSTRSVRH